MPAPGRLPAQVLNEDCDGDGGERADAGFSRDRDAYRAKAREHLRQFDVSVLGYCVTSNHEHMLLDASERLEVSESMREVASEFAGAYSQRKDRANAFWGNNCQQAAQGVARR